MLPPENQYREAIRILAQGKRKKGVHQQLQAFGRAPDPGIKGPRLTYQRGSLYERRSPYRQVKT